MEFRFRVRPSWPTLAWVACGTIGQQAIDVRHGRGVETSDQWFGEIVWDGPFAAGEFDQSDLVYGSGARCRGDHVTFVSASHILDRLVWCTHGDEYWVSNSLPALLTEAAIKIDPLYTKYPRDFTTITEGLSGYQREIARASRDVQLLYHDNLRVSREGLKITPKPVIQRDLCTFASYREFLIESLIRCATNLRCPQRGFPYEMLGTVSSGFDSPTVTALARSADLKEVITILSARGGGDDSGAAIGRRLGLDVHELRRDAWKSFKLPEVSFLSADAKGEDVHFRGAQSLLQGRVLLTGYSATAWATAWATSQKPLTDLQRADQSGLSLTEYRLWAGFIHFPVPSMGLRSGGDIFKVNLADEMRPWRTGRKYDKPICRRILVETGVPDSMFGIEKKATTVLLFDRRSFLSSDSLADFSDYLREIRRGNAIGLSTHQAKVVARSLAARTALTTASLMPGSFARRIRNSVRVNETAFRDARYDYLFGWATKHAIARYRYAD